MSRLASNGGQRSMALFTPALVMMLAFSAATSFAEDLGCLTKEEQQHSTLYAQLQREAYAALDRRLEAYETLKTPEEIREYQTRLRTFFERQLGGFPERTPLNAETVKTISADGYRIECVIFESQPNHHITANLYLPDSDKPVPGVVVSSGHSRTAKTADYNQRFGIMMASQGMAALCFDPIGQGERSQILKEDGQPQFSGTTTEHSLMGVGSILVGRNTARYRVWDAMRAIDYLASRREVDASRIGFTGCSGGGTLTSYVMALDDRVLCAAPACYLTTFRHLIEALGPQDAEQNIYGQVAFGMDQPDYVIMHAPKPVLISSTTGDFFDIRGSWENYRQAKRIFGRLGAPHHVDLVEIEGRHGVQPQNLATIAQWMRRWLADSDQEIAAREITTRAPEELWCTETGQVLHRTGERSVLDLNADHANALMKRRETRERLSDPELREQIRQMLSVPAVESISSAEWKDIGRTGREGYHIDRLVLNRGEGTVPLPGLTFHPPSPSDDAYLYLHDQGRLGDSEVGGAIEKLVTDGYAVVSVDLSGQGETALEKVDPVLTDWKTFYMAYLMGKPLLGIRTHDALVAADFVAHYQKDRSNPRKVHLVGVGRAGLIALHAAALAPDRFASVTVRDCPRSWNDVVRQPSPTGILDCVVHNALSLYDIPDLKRLIGSIPVSVEDPQP
ncbi:MAG: acetylxylan esterase [Planctomycetaceae bacterium]|nr:acetylxylan esterase [Planctomycetaceae bacterium]